MLLIDISHHHRHVSSTYVDLSPTPLPHPHLWPAENAPSKMIWEFSLGVIIFNNIWVYHILTINIIMVYRSQISKVQQLSIWWYSIYTFFMIHSNIMYNIIQFMSSLNTFFIILIPFCTLRSCVSISKILCCIVLPENIEWNRVLHFNPYSLQPIRVNPNISSTIFASSQ